MMQHVSQSMLEGYVIGALSDLESAAVEEHVMACASCTARLQKEARLELAFAAVAERVPERSRRAYLIAPAVGGAIAMAAAILLWIAPRDAASDQRPQTADDQATTTISDTNGDASTVTASLDTQADGSRVGVRD